MLATVLPSARLSFDLDTAVADPLGDWDCGGTGVKAGRVVGAAIAERRAEMGYFSPRLAGMGGLVRRDTDNARRNATLRVLAVPLTELFDQFQVPPSCAAPS